MRIRIIFLITVVLLIIQACEGQRPPIPIPEGLDVKAGAPKVQTINADEPVAQPFAAYLKVQVRDDDNPATNHRINYSVQDCEGNWSNEMVDNTREFEDLNPSGYIVQEDGFVVWDRNFIHENQCNDIPDIFRVSYALDLDPDEHDLPEGQKWGAVFEIRIIDDHEGSDVPGNEFKHQRDLNQPQAEVPGDGFHDAEAGDVYADYVHPARKDLFIELDIPINDDWIDEGDNLSNIITTLKTIFNTAGINLHVFVGQIDIPERYSSRDDIKAHLHNDRDLNLQRKALHVVVLSEQQGRDDLLGSCIQLQGDPPFGDGNWDYECFDEVYDTQLGYGGYGALDSVGCVIFWEVFDRARSALGPGWTELDAFCSLVAHEIGHALGVYVIGIERLNNGVLEGCIMSHHLDNRITEERRPHALEFYGGNVDNLEVPGIEQPFSNAFNLRDIIGIHTTSVRSGNIFPDNINP